MEDRLTHLRTHFGCHAIIKESETFMINDEIEFDANADLLGFKNGVLDFENECFRPYEFNDYITMSCGFEFRPLLKGFKVITEEGTRNVTEDNLTDNDNQEFEELRDVFQKIFPDDSMRNYFFKIMSTGLSGRAIEKFFILQGSGGNGKSLSSDLMEASLGDYFTDLSNKVFTEKYISNSGSANPEMAKLNKKRFVKTTEPKAHVPLQNDVIKSLTGGNSISARNLFSKNTKVKLCLTMVFECNKIPILAEEYTNAEERRIEHIQFKSQFTTDTSICDEITGQTNHIYPVNPLLKLAGEWSRKHRNVWINLLTHHLIEVKNACYIVEHFRPTSVIQNSQAYLQKSCDIHMLFQTYFEIAREYVVYEESDWTLQKIQQFLRNTEEFKALPKFKQKENNKERIIEFFKINNLYKDNVYFNSDKHAFLLRNYRLKSVTN
jgi:hypothetical protein